MPNRRAGQYVVGAAPSVRVARLQVRSDVGASGVMFTLDTESGFRDVVFITSSYGLGEMVVQGAVNPDEFYVYKPALSAGRKAVLRRNLGSKHLQMIYAPDGAEDPVLTTDVAQEIQSDADRLMEEARTTAPRVREAVDQTLDQG